MSVDTSILAELRGIHPPPLNLTDTIAATLAAFAIGLGLAMLTGIVLRGLTARRNTPKADALSRLAEARNLPPDRRLLAQARVLHEHRDSLGEQAAALAAKLREALYRPDARLDPDEIDAAIRNALKRGAR